MQVKYMFGSFLNAYCTNVGLKSIHLRSYRYLRGFGILSKISEDDVRQELGRISALSLSSYCRGGILSISLVLLLASFLLSSNILEPTRN